MVHKRCSSYGGRVLTSTLVGGSLGLLGTYALPQGHRSLSGAMLLFSVIAALFLETGSAHIRLVQIRRQTHGGWSRRYGGRIAALLWGLDIGLIVTTWFTFAGVWVVLAAAFISRSMATGALLTSAYWFGRALSAWLGPIFIGSAADVPELITELSGQTRLFRLVNLATLAWLCILSSAMLIAHQHL